MKKLGGTKILLTILVGLMANCSHNDFSGLSASALFPPPPPSKPLYSARLLFSSPSNQVSAIVSPDGKNLLYVSNEQGNCDLYSRPLGGGEIKALTKQTADDLEPTFSPDGKLIAYVSMEDDAKGDIWIMKSNGSKKRPLTGRQTADRSPIFSPDGQFIYYTAQQGVHSRSTIMRVNVNNGQSEVIVTGLNPAPLADGRHLVFTSFDDQEVPRLFALDLADRSNPPHPLTDGAYADGFPYITTPEANLETIIFSRFCNDTNRDGIVDGDDKPSLWRLDLSTANQLEVQAVYPLTTGESAEIFGSIHGDLLFFTATDEASGTKVLPIGGIVPPGLPTATLLTMANSSDNADLRLMLLRYLISRGGQAEQQARYQLAVYLADERQYGAAINELNMALAIGGDSNYQETLKLERYRLTALLNSHNLTSDKQRLFLRQQLAELPSLTTLRNAKYWMTWVELAYRAGIRQDLPAILNNVLQMADANPEDIANAQRYWAYLTWQLDKREEAIGYEMATLRLSAPLGVYKNRAIKRLLRENPTVITTNAYLRELATKGQDIPALAAAALLQLGDLYWEENQLTLAKDVYQELLTNYPNQTKEAASALLALAKIARQQGNSDQFLNYLEHLITTYSSQSSQYKEAKAMLGGSALDIALRAEAAGNLPVAYEQFQRIIKGDPQAIIAHRHLLKIGDKLGKTNELISYYQQEIQTNGVLAIYHYGLGLALTYLGPDHYKAADEQLAKALQLDPKMAAALLTRGWIEEQLYQHSPYSNHLEKAVDYYNGALTVANHRELTAAANLNLGNGFFLMGKDDLAFSSYLARELEVVPFDSLEQELIFRERFGRVAERLEYHDVALTELHDGEQLAAANNYPRHGEIMLLLAMTYYSLEEYSEAASWYGQAAAFFRKNHNSIKELTAKRAQGYALELTGNYSEAEKSFRAALNILAQNGGPASHHYELLEFEMEMESGNVTRAPYGFDAKGEEELIYHKLATVLQASGNRQAAAAYYAKKLPLLEKARKNRHIGEAVNIDLIIAYNQAGRLLALSGHNKEAWDFFNKAWRLDLPEGKVFALANMLALLRFGFDISAEKMGDFEIFWLNKGDICNNNTWQSYCLSSALSLAAYKLGRLRHSLTNPTKDINILFQYIDQDAAALANAITYLQEAGKWAENDHDMAFIRALLAATKYYDGQHNEARELMATALTQVNNSDRWRLLVAQSTWDQEQKGPLTLAAAAALSKESLNGRRELLWSHDFQTLMHNVFTLLPAAEQSQAILQVVDLWRSLQLDMGYIPFNATNFTTQLGAATYLFQQSLEGVELLLLYHQGKWQSFSGAAAEATNWLASQPLPSGPVYLDSLSATSWRPVAWPQDLTIYRVPQPALLQKALNDRTFALNEAVSWGPEAGEASRLLPPDSSLAELTIAGTNSAAVWVTLPIALTTEGPGKRLDHGAEDQPLILPEWKTPRLIYTRLQHQDNLPPPPNNIVTNYLADNAQLATSRLAAQSILSGASQIEMRFSTGEIQTFGAAPLDQTGEKQVASRQFNTATRAGVTYYQHSSWPEAIRSFNESIQAMSFLGANTAIVRSRLMEAYINNNEQEKAIPEANKMRSYYLEKKQQKEAADTGSTLAIIYYYLKRYPEAITLFDQVANEYLALNMNTLAAETFSRAGTAEGAQGNYQGALDYYQKALSVLSPEERSFDYNINRLIGITKESRLSDYQGALSAFNNGYQGAVKSQNIVMQQTLRLDLARVERELGNYSQALKSAQDLLAEMGEITSNLVAQVLLEIARIYWYQGQYREALAAQQQVLDLAHLLSDGYLEIQAYSLRGLIQRNQGDLPQAEQSLRQALLLAESSGRPAEVASQLNNLGIVLREQKHIHASIRAFEKALLLDRENNSQEGVAYDLRNLALSQIASLDFKNAADNLHTALEISERLSIKYNQLECIFALGSLSEKQGDFTKAQAYYGQASQLAQVLSAKEIEWRAQYFLAALALKNGDREKALDLLYNSIGLVEQLAVRSSEEREPSRKQLFGALIDLLLDEKQPAAALTIVDRYQQLLFANYSTLKQPPKGATTTLSFDNLPLPPQTGLLAIWQSDQTLTLWWWDHIQGLKTSRQPLTSEKLYSLLESITARLNNFMPLDNELSQLGQLILAPFGTDLQTIKQLGIIADGPMVTMPFAALSYNGQNLHDRQITPFIIPALTLLKDGLSKPQSLMIAGDDNPYTPYAKFEIAALRNEHQSFLRPVTQPLFGTTGLATTSILHLAGHTAIDSQNPLTSLLIIDKNLRLPISTLLENKSLPALVVLSSCSIDDGKGDNYQLLNRALLQSGSQRVLASSKRVSDLTTALLMKHFYRFYLNQNEGPLSALYHAQKQVRLNYPHPAYWATFIVAGGADQ